MTKKKLLLVDGNSVAFRAFFALHNSLERFKNKNGLHTNAIYAFHNMIDTVLKREMPTHVLVAFDAGKVTFRHEFYQEYKDGRSKTPAELSEQFPYLRQLIEALGMTYYELKNYEADDIIGTLAKKVAAEEFDVVVLSGDRDLTQLADQHIKVDVTVKGVNEVEEYTPEHIQEKYGLEPKQIIDMKGLAGDASDNIPGVTKIGEKTAIKLLKEYHSVEGIYEHIDELKKSKMKENLVNEKEIALLSKKLATINTEAPVEIEVEDLVYRGKDLEKLIPFYKEMDFKSFLSKLDTSGVAEEPFAEIAYQVVTEPTAEMFTAEMSLYVEMLDENYHRADIVGVAWGNTEKIYVAQIEDLMENQAFQNWLQSDQKKWVYDAKRTLVALTRYHLPVSMMTFDVLLAGYLLNTNDQSVDIADVAAHYGLHDISSDEMIYGKGAKKGLPEPEVLHEHLARKAQVILQLVPKLKAELEEKDQATLFSDMELPLSTILAQMEMTGITASAQTLQKMKQEFSVRLQEIEARIYEEAGEEFNINSPKQLGVILFEKMQLPVIKKTKTGYSTAVDVLEQLKDRAPIVADILNYRQIAKIQSTYVEGLLKVIHPEDGKIHTRYVQTLTQTGRLSSVDPNLQNIPIRLPEGRKIRQAFVPSQADWQIFSSDYSQIELRVLAHISGDEHLQAAFLEDQDIHASTAMRVFGIATPEEVTPNMRRQAKAVNFGIVYGISDYGLSQNLGISRKQAQQFIDTYFEKYPGVRKYMAEIVAEAKEKGYVETLYHRRRYLPDIHAKNFNLRSFAERTAINTPIQGSAADILKIAMIKLAARLEKEQLQARMLLQVHDELVFEVPTEEIEQLAKIVREEMEQAVELKVPLKVDCNYGPTWYDAK